MQNLTFQADFGSGFHVIKPPRNWKDIKAQIIFTRGDLQAQLQSIIFEFVNAEADAIYSYQQGGLIGSYGILEGSGLRMYGTIPGLASVLILDMCLNTADQAFTVQNGIVFVPVKEIGKIDGV